MAPSVRFTPSADATRAESVRRSAAERRLHERLEQLGRTQRELDALQARRARELTAVVDAALALEAEQGGTGAAAIEFARRSARAEIALTLRTSEAAAGRAVRHAELLDALPAVQTAVESGTLSWRAAETISQQAELLLTTLPPDTSPTDRDTLLDEFGIAAATLGAVVAPSRLRPRLAALRERLTTATAIERHHAARAERHVTLDDGDNGMSWLGAYLPSVEAHAVFNRLTDMARIIPEYSDDAEQDDRTLAQRRADLLVDFLAGDHVRVGGWAGYERRVGQGLDFGRFAGIRPTVVVTVPVQTLLDVEEALGSAAEPALLDGIVPIDPATARALTANAPSVYRLLTDPHTGAHLDLGRRRYEVSTAVRLWLRIRDGGCRFPGCGRPAKGCDVDHSVDWQYGGATRPENLAHLCRGHHTLKHHGGWNPHQDPDGTIRWRSPSGEEHVTRPDQPFARAG